MARRHVHTSILSMLAAVAALALGWAWIELDRDVPAPPVVDPRLAEGTDPVDRPQRHVLAEARAVGSEDRVSLSRAVAVDAPCESVVEVPSRPRPSRVAGRLVVHATEALAGAPVPVSRVRALSATRLADVPWGGGVLAPAIRLSPGTYAVWIEAPGYEPAEVHGVVVRAGESTEIAPIPLELGSARITGRVAVAARDSGWGAELLGTGRRPCGACAVWPCPVCGYDRGRSLLALDEHGAFAFFGLASGCYTLRVLDAGGHEIGAPVQVDVTRAGVLQLDVPVEATRTLRVSVADTDGTWLDGPWSAWLRTSKDARELERSHARAAGPDSWTCSVSKGETTLASGEFESPRPPGAPSERWRSVVFRCGGGLSRERDDVRRRSDDELRPRALYPMPPAGDLAARVQADGLVRVEHVPARAEHLVLRCGAFVAEAVIPHVEDTLALRLRPDGDEDDPAVPPTFLAWELDVPR